MKKLQLIIILLFSCYFTNAQKNIKIPVATKMSKIFKEGMSQTTLSFSVSDNEDGMFVGKRYKKGYVIEHYNKELKLIEESDFILDNRRNIINDAFISGDQLCLIERSRDRKNRELVYKAFLSPKKNMKFTAKKLLTISEKEIRSSYFSSNIDNDIFGDYIISKNHKFIVFAFDLNNRNSEKHKVIVFNNTLEKTYETEFERNIKDRKFKLQNIDVDENNGTVYLLGKVYTKEKRKKKDGGRYQYELTKIKGNQRKTLVFDSDINHISGLKTLIQNDKLTCIGFYSEKRENRYKGLVHFKINDMKVTNVVYSPFTEQFLIDKFGKKRQKELRNIAIRKIIVTKDDDLIINAEEYYYVTTTNFKTGATYTTYYFMDMISAKLSENGKLIWARNINKKQISGSFSPPYLSYISTYVNGDNYFLINGSRIVNKLSNNRIQFKSSITNNHNLYVIKIDDKGNAFYYMLLDKKETKIGFAVNRAVTFNDGKSILFQGRKGTKKRILRLDFK